MGRRAVEKTINTDAFNGMLKRVQHDKKKCVIPNLFRNLEIDNDNPSIAFVLVHPITSSPYHLTSSSLFPEGFNDQ